MKDAFRSVRGAFDQLPRALSRRRQIEAELRAAAELFGYEEVETPVLEHAALFERSLGQGSEVVSKEMFCLQSRTADSDRVVLRPENTTSVLRATLNAGLQYSFPHQFFYSGPQFRYERPQKGRAREFHQFGVECLGRQSAVADVECILTAVEGLRRLGLLQKTRLKLNTLGASEKSRIKYNQVLMEHFQTWKGELSEDTQTRIKDGRILRALDSKSKQDVECISVAPELIEFLPKDDVERFQDVVAMLRDDYKVENIELDSRLVRGLDYYSHTCFEFVSEEDELTVLAGGRYDGLAKTLGYSKMEVPAVGWAAGLERLVLLSHNKPEENKQVSFAHVDMLLVPLYEGDSDKDNKIRRLLAQVSSRSRAEGVSCRIWGGLPHDAGSSGKGVVKKSLKDADNCGAVVTCFIGATEAESQKVSVRKMSSGTIQSLDINSKVAEWIL